MTKPSNDHGAVGLCLGGGGLTGAMYEVGVLAAVEDAIEDFRAADFDLFVGVGSGTPVACALAGGVSALRIYRALLDPADDFFPLARAHLLQFDSPELKRMGRSALGASKRMVRSLASRRGRTDLWSEIDRFYDSMPAGLCSLVPFEQLLADMWRRRGIADRFADLPGRVLVVTNDLDRGEPAIFGVGHRDDVPVTRAIAAACASPGLYAPVQIGDRDYVASAPSEARHVELAVNEGCTTVLMINALIPVHANGRSAVPTGHGPGDRVRDKGLLWVLNQHERIVTEAVLHSAVRMLNAEGKVDVHLIEPQKQDALMFMHPSMDFATRRRILKEGYTAARRLLSNPQSTLRRAIEARREARKAAP
jgi:NTE family protein